MDTKWIIVALAILMPATLMAACRSDCQKAEPPAAAQAPAPAEIPMVGTVESYEGEPEAALDANLLPVNIDGQDMPLSCLFGASTIIVISREACPVSTTDFLMTPDAQDRNIAVLEVDVNPLGCSAERTCAMARGEAGRSIISLCDSSDSIRSVLGVIESQPEVVLLDADGRVTDYRSLDEFDNVRYEAERQAYSESLKQAPSD